MMSQELGPWAVFLDFLSYWALSVVFLVIGRAVLELRQSGSFADGFRGFFTSRVVADVFAVTVVFVLPFSYSGWAVWREFESSAAGFFIPITSAVVMFQMGIALKAYADLAFSSSRTPTAASAGGGERPDRQNP